MKSNFKAHPWHGIPIGDLAPKQVTCFIEIVPTDTVKYEIDKATGYLKIDRPQQYSNVLPALYGFIPQTFCGEQIARLASDKSGRVVEHGDDLILQAIPIGGFRLIDKGEADDKIIAVLKGDAMYGQYTELGQLPEAVVKRLRHYFLTYKNLPEEPAVMELANIYGQAEAWEVIQTSINDYKLM